MRIQYCGGWGYLKYAKDLVKEVESNVANKYQYLLEKDPGTTGNFEITIFKSDKDMKKNVNGNLIHSKKGTRKFPKDVDHAAFMNQIVLNTKWENYLFLLSFKLSHIIQTMKIFF